MTEYITKEEAKKAVDYAVELLNSEYDAICDQIDRIPNADLALVVHAHWIRFENDIARHQCSSCGINVWINVFGLAPIYCPNCGAKMDLEDEK